MLDNNYVNERNRAEVETKRKTYDAVAYMDRYFLIVYQYTEKTVMSFK